ncbi:DUF1579 family protein [Namhaeicola litoreus]|uniref:DUF1579 family protein n=1 Tax=Namhaeicola litoreus TaxID=1052145 RepID=A0ABW3XYS7_9FLAO
MKKVILYYVLCMIGFTVQSQEYKKDMFDFWVGDWNLTWTNQDGSVGKATNSISKILDELVLWENFVAEGQNGLKGMSYSVYNAQQKSWKQTWVDNQGSHIVLNGLMEEGNPVFMTVTTETNTGTQQFRMVFSQITPNSFIWDWQRKTNDGSWQSSWKINYNRK